MKHVFKRIMSVVVVLCLMLPITAHAAGTPATNNSSNETQSIGSVNTTTTSNAIMLKLNETQAYLNGNMIPTLVYDSGYVSKLIMINGSTFLPLRFVCQCLGFDVGYNEETNNSTITDMENGVRFELVTGTTEMYKYDLYGNLLASGTATAPTTIIEGVTHVPVRSLLEAMGFYVYWDDKGYVLISKSPMTTGEFQSLIDSWGKTDNQYTDTDGDGIPDIFETDLFHTNPNNPDTDGDGLTDGYEINILGTDPLKQDTDENGVLDGSEDFDNDGLTNDEEYLLGTDPNNADTDGDSLTDGEEANTYQTDPLNPDSDEDKINDGDEIIMGLNPLSSQTFGIPDSQYIFTQTISSAKLADTNTDNLYELQIDIQAAGNANTSLSIHESLSSTNNAIFGKPVALSYDENLSFDEITINFILNTDCISAPTGLYDDTGLEGIQRFQIFRFDEETASLYPIETSYDTVKNTLTATIEELGDYMVIDLDMWMYTLGIIAESVSPTPPQNTHKSVQDKTEYALPSASGSEETLSVSKLEESDVYYDKLINEQIKKAPGAEPENLNNSPANGLPQYNKQIDLVFAFNNSYSTATYIKTESIYNKCTATQLEHWKMNINRIVADLYNAGISANVSIVEFNGNNTDFIIHRTNGSMWAKTPVQVEQMLSVVNPPEYKYLPVASRHLDALEKIMDFPFRQNVPKVVLLLTDQAIKPQYNTCGKTTEIIANELNERNIITSFAVPTMSYFDGIDESYQPLYETTGGFINHGLCFDQSFGGIWHVGNPPTQSHLFSDPGMTNFIIKDIEDRTYTYIGANDLCVRTLHTPITKNGTTDSDGDSLTDWQETDKEALEFFAQTPYNDGDVITDLPTFAQYMYYSNFYVSNQFSRLKQHYSDELAELLVLPIVSDPMNADSDGDWIRDNLDPKPLKGNPANISSDLSSDLMGQLQDWLVSLGYLDMLDNPYGVSYGVLTHTAVNLYRLNHGMALTEEKTLDRQTFAMIANDYFNRFNDGQNRYYSILPNSAAAYRSYVPHIQPTLSDKYANLGITVTLMSNKDIKSDCDRYGVSVPERNLYFYDYTAPVTKILKETAAISIESTSEFDDSDSGNIALVNWWMSRVNHEKEWDIKLDYNWEKMFPDIKYYAQRFPFVFNQKTLTSEDLGNVIYGYLGYAIGFSDWELYRGSEFAAILKEVPDTVEDKANMLWGMVLYCEQNNIPFLPTIKI